MAVNLEEGLGFAKLCEQTIKTPRPPQGGRGSFTARQFGHSTERAPKRLWQRSRLAVIATAKQLIRPVLDGLGDKVHRTIDEAEVAPLRVIRLKAPRRVPVVHDIEHGLVGVGGSAP